MILNEKTYSVLADLARIILPAIAAFYVLLGDTWGVPYPKEISATIMGVCAMLGEFLKISSKKYFSTGKIYFPKVEEDNSDADAD